MSVSESLYAVLQAMATERGKTVSECVEEWVGVLARLPVEDRRLVLRVARVLRNRDTQAQWIQVIEVCVLLAIDA